MEEKFMNPLRMWMRERRDGLSLQDAYSVDWISCSSSGQTRQSYSEVFYIITLIISHVKIW